jgi:hypothetical protein
MFLPVVVLIFRLIGFLAQALLKEIQLFLSTEGFYTIDVTPRSAIQL